MEIDKEKFIKDKWQFTETFRKRERNDTGVDAKKGKRKLVKKIGVYVVCRGSTDSSESSRKAVDVAYKASVGYLFASSLTI